MSQCTAHRKSGGPCRAQAVSGTNVCRVHGGNAPQVRRRAAQRLLEASDSAAAYLVKVVEDDTKPEAIRLAAARDLLDRAGLGGRERVEIEVVAPEPAPWEKLVSSGIIRVVHGLPDRAPAALPTTAMTDDARPAPRELKLTVAPNVPTRAVPPSDSEAARANYEANKGAPDPVPRNWVERVDGPRPRPRRGRA